MKYDVAVVGGGIAGLSAALFAGHAGLRVLVFDNGKSQIKKVPELRNQLGAPGISGEELLAQYRAQTKDFVELREAEVTSVEPQEDGFTLTADGEKYVSTRVVIATNLNTQLLEDLGLEMGINENVRSGKIKKVIGVDWEGRTNIPNLYIAGLLANLPSQVMIAAGQGAAVGVRIAQEAVDEKYMWHDS